MKPTVKVEGITLHRNGKPLTASDIPEGAEITFDRTTGEVTAVTPPEIASEACLERLRG